MVRDLGGTGPTKVAARARAGPEPETKPRWVAPVTESLAQEGTLVSYFSIPELVTCSRLASMHGASIA